MIEDNNLKVDILKNIRGKNSLGNVIDRNFKELIPKEIFTATSATVEEFLQLFDEYVYTLPLTGTNSVQYIFEKSADILNITVDNGLNLQELLDEITLLKDENLQLLEQVTEAVAETQQ
jgi:hypothetical protein